MAVTCALSARPDPVTAALTSLGVWKVTGSPRRAAASATTPPACAVPIAVRTLYWLNTRSTATTSGRCRSSHSSTASATREQPGGQLGVGRRADHADRHGSHGPPDPAVHDGDAAPGQPGVHPQHAHRTLSREHQFEA